MSEDLERRKFILKIDRETRVRVIGTRAVKKWLSLYPGAEVISENDEY